MEMKQALQGPHGEIGEYQSDADYFGSPGVMIRRIAGDVTIPACHIGTEWCPILGRVVIIERETGRWSTPVERRFGVVVE